MATPVLYDNFSTSDIGIWGQTFTSGGWPVIGIDVYIADPTRPDDGSVNELLAPFNLVFYDVDYEQEPVLLASRTIGAPGEEFSGLTSFDLSEPVPTVPGSLYFFGFESATDSFGVGIRHKSESTYSEGDEIIFEGTPLPTSLGGNARDLSFRIRAIPEPSTVALLAGSIAVLIRRRYGVG